MDKDNIREITIGLFMILGTICLYRFDFAPSKTLHDFKYVAYFKDGGSETRKIDSVSYYRRELLNSGWKFVYCRYINGENEPFVDYVTRYHLYTIKTYNNETEHYKHYSLVNRIILGIFILNIIVFICTFIPIGRKRKMNELKFDSDIYGDMMKAVTETREKMLEESSEHYGIPTKEEIEQIVKQSLEAQNND